MSFTNTPKPQTVWMRPPDGGDPIEVPEDEISQRAWQGYVQTEPPVTVVSKPKDITGRSE